MAGLEAIGLWTLAGTYCTDYLTDGAVPEWFVESWPKGKALAGKLVSVGLWATASDGWQFLSWNEYQRTKDQVLVAKEKAAERKAKFIESKVKNK